MQTVKMTRDSIKEIFHSRVAKVLFVIAKTLRDAMLILFIKSRQFRH